MDDFHKRLVAGVDSTTACVSAILNINRYKKREMLLGVRSKYMSDRADRMAARIVSDIISR